MKVKFQRHSRIGADVHDAGTECDVEDEVGKHLISTGRAVSVAEKKSKAPKKSDPSPDSYFTKD